MLAEVVDAVIGIDTHRAQEGEVTAPVFAVARRRVPRMGLVPGELKPALFSRYRDAGDPGTWCPPSQLGLSMGAHGLSA